MINEPKRETRNNHLPAVELTEDQLKQVSGGLRDAADGLPSGQRSHRPFSVLQY